MPRPCPAALAAFGVPARRWDTRADLYCLLDRAKTFLDSAPNGAFIQDAAKIANLSPYHFAHRFRETFGTSPAAYHRAALLERAKSLLMACPVGETALQLGFQSESAFIRSFRRATGVTPGKWKERSQAAAG